MPNGQVTITATFVETEAPVGEPFLDVNEGDWFYAAVAYAYENGLMDGVGGNRFAPNSATTRAQLVTILYRMEGQPAVSGDLPFTDVESGTWYTDAILWAAQNGIVNGVNDTEFAPGNDLTREQLVTILYRYAESKGYDVSASADLAGYPDGEEIQAYAREAMAWAVAENIIQGMEDDTLKPAGNASRAQIATILMRFSAGTTKPVLTKRDCHRMHPVAVLFCVGGMVCGWADSIPSPHLPVEFGERSWYHTSVLHQRETGERSSNQGGRTMYQRTITKATLAAFHRHLQEAERRPATIAKYLREVQDFARHLEPGQPVEKETVLAWKAALAQRYAAGTVNGKLAALNTFFAFLGWGECRVKPLRRQRELFRDSGRELHKGDYLRLLAAAKGAGNWRLYYLMETLASTGIRVSELKFVTV